MVAHGTLIAVCSGSSGGGGSGGSCGRGRGSGDWLLCRSCHAQEGQQSVVSPGGGHHRGTLAFACHLPSLLALVALADQTRLFDSYTPGWLVFEPSRAHHLCLDSLLTQAAEDRGVRPCGDWFRSAAIQNTADKRPGQQWRHAQSFKATSQSSLHALGRWVSPLLAPTGRPPSQHAQHTRLASTLGLALLQL